MTADSNFYLWDHPTNAPRVARPEDAGFAVGDPLWVRCYPVEVCGASQATAELPNLPYLASREKYAMHEVVSYARVHGLACYEAGRASRAQTEWQPIETAPQTGRTLLLGYFNALGKWRTLRGQWFTDAVIQEEWTNSDVHEAGWFETSVECDDEDSGCWPTDPTHWQPLPSAPATLGERK